MEDNEALNEALNNVTNAMGAAVELSAFLFDQLVKKGFTREEALEITKDYLLGMITTRRDKDGET